MENLNHAFDVADRELGIPRLLDAEDLVEQSRPDERLVLLDSNRFFLFLIGDCQKFHRIF